MTSPEHLSSPWYTSSYSGANGGHCVEVATTANHTALRDTRHRDLTTLTFTHHEWHALIHELKHHTHS